MVLGLPRTQTICTVYCAVPGGQGLGCGGAHVAQDVTRLLHCSTSLRRLVCGAVAGCLIR